MNCCSFCADQIETTEHLFYECKFAYTFWEDLHYWLFPKFEDLPVFTKENIIFGMLMKNEAHDLAVNTFIILGKFFIHKNRFLKTLPNFIFFHKELCHYFLSLKLMKKKNALILSTLIEDVKLSENP